MSSASYRVAKLAPGFDLGAFDCGEPLYNEWLANDATRAVESGSAAVHLLVETPAEAGDQSTGDRVVGYFAICPTLIVRDDAPKRVRRGLLRSAPGWLLAKLALDQSLRGNPERQWGRQLLREALLTIIAAAELGAGQVIVVDPDNAGLVAWYAANGFLGTGGPDLRMYLKVATARAYLQ
ncbi:GNAT family N-acetyltransferase [Jatrophihabitans sp. DSM 45814]